MSRCGETSFSFSYFSWFHFRPVKWLLLRTFKWSWSGCENLTFAQTWATKLMHINSPKEEQVNPMKLLTQPEVYDRSIQLLPLQVSLTNYRRSKGGVSSQSCSNVSLATREQLLDFKISQRVHSLHQIYTSGSLQAKCWGGSASFWCFEHPVSNVCRNKNSLISLKKF